MQIAIIILHVLVCVGLILVVLLQAGKGANMGAVFGGSSQTIFGSSGPGTFLSKVTTAVAIIFMCTSLGLSYFASAKGGTMMKKVSRPVAPVQQPAQPAALPQVPTAQLPKQAVPAAQPSTPAGPAQPVTPASPAK